jgi:hypothetical protein
MLAAMSCLLAMCLVIGERASAHEGHSHVGESTAEGVVGNWLFRPKYALYGNAKNDMQPDAAVATSIHSEIERETLPVKLQGQLPTERVHGLLKRQQLPREAFAVEAWVNYHVNRPVGVAIVAGGPDHTSESGWTLACYGTDDGTAQITLRLNLQNQDGPVVLKTRADREGGYLEYWWHVVATFDGTTARLFVNGRLQAEINTTAAPIRYAADADFEIAAYLENEPHMQLANLVHHVRLFDHATPAEEIGQRYAALQQQVEQGVVYPQLFHFAAGPYLNYVTQDGISIVWETDRPTTSRVEWGPTAALGQSAEVAGDELIKEYRITGLETHTPYFYRITATDQDGHEIDSGTLTFQTAVHDDEPFKFAVFGDTETRPHINNQIAQLVWGERPNFVVNLGDLTDGGMRDAKFQWNLEYFLGITSLASRVAVFPVPGNGEGDLYWYKRYHALPGDESPYSFRFGNAEFFMLDSNRKRRQFAEAGKQYQWLEDRLRESTATWKFVCFHHAPYTSDEDDYGNAWADLSTQGDPETRPLVPLFETYNVDVVMFGHLHMYERSWPIRNNRVEANGVHYLLAGGGGGNLEDFAPNAAHFSARGYRGHHYCLFSIHDHALRLSMHDLTGALRDSLDFSKSPSDQVDLPLARDVVESTPVVD